MKKPYILNQHKLVERAILFYIYANLFDVWLDFPIPCIQSVAIYCFVGSL